MARKKPRRSRSKAQQGLVIGPTPAGPDVESAPQAWVASGTLRDDDAIAADVRRRLAEHAALDASAVRVSVDHGEVTLDGTVSDPPARHVAELIADAVPGVRDVVNRLATSR
jgi:osmotically-inducible protein OsmY